MVDIVRPAYGEAWASVGEKVSPTLTKIQGGWIQEMMPYQWENFLQNRQDTALLYMLQKGVPEWDASQEYIAGKSVVTYQTNLYISVLDSTNVLPTVQASWKKLNPSTSSSGVVTVAGGGTGASTAADARTNLGLGTIATATAPTTNGIVVRSAADTLVSRSITGTTNNIVVTNGDGVAGDISINAGSNVALLNTDSSWTSTGSIRLPSGSTSQQGASTPGRVRFNLETNEFHGAYSDGWKVLAKPASAEQTSIIDVGNFYTSSNVEGALQEVGLKASFVKDAILSYPDYASASATAATLPEGQVVDVESDETRDYLRTRYKIENGALVYVGLNADAASTSYGGGSVGEALDLLNQTNNGAFVAVSVPVGSDGTAALQAAIDAWALNPNLEVRIIGVCDVQGTVQVPNKETDNPEKRLTIIGGSLKKMNAGFMFTKKAGQQLPDGTPLQTGHITFDNVRFLGNREAVGSFIIDGDNIVRVKFVNCYGDGMQIAYANGYLQSIYVDSASVFRKWYGWLFDCDHLYDVKFYGTAESGLDPNGGFLVTRNAAADPAANSLVVRGCIEGIAGKVFDVGACWASVIDGSYQEQNWGGDYDFGKGTALHKGLTIIGCGFQPFPHQLSNPDYFPVRLGKGAANSITLIGNSSSGNLFHVAAGNESAIIDLGNYAAAGYKKFSDSSTRVFEIHNGLELRFRLNSTAGVGMHAFYSKLGFENASEVVGGERVTAGITYGANNPQSFPGFYAQQNWVAGTVVYSTAPTVAQRQFGSITTGALVVGWQCVTSGTPGTWREIAVMMPY